MTDRVTIQEYYKLSPDRSIHRGLIRLLAWAARQDETFRILGISARELARRQLAEYTDANHALLVAISKDRPVGLSVISHEPGESLLLGHKVWEIRKILLAPQAPKSASGKLTAASMEYMDSEQGLLRARVAAWDGASISALISNHFQVITGEAVCVFHGRSHGDVKHPEFSFVFLEPKHIEDASMLEVSGSALSWRGMKSTEFDAMQLMVDRMLRLSLENSQVSTIVAHHGERLVGYLQVDLSHGHWNGLMARISPAVILPRYMSKGVFELLVRRALVLISEKKIHAASIHLPVNEHSTSRQLKSLRKLGFTVVRSDLLLRRWSDHQRLHLLDDDKAPCTGQLPLQRHISQKLGVQPPNNRPGNIGSPLLVPPPPGGFSSSLPSSRRGEYSS